MEPFILLLLIIALDVLVIQSIIKRNSEWKIFYVLLVVLVPILGISIYYLVSHAERGKCR